MENQTMKKTFVKTVTLIMLAASLGAYANMTQTQRNTAAGAVLGGVAGNLIGGEYRLYLGWCGFGWCYRQSSSYPLLILYSVKNKKGRLNVQMAFCFAVYSLTKVTPVSCDCKMAVRKAVSAFGRTKLRR